MRRYLPLALLTVSAIAPAQFVNVTPYWTTTHVYAEGAGSTYGSGGPQDDVSISGTGYAARQTADVTLSSSLIDAKVTSTSRLDPNGGWYAGAQGNRGYSFEILAPTTVYAAVFTETAQSGVAGPDTYHDVYMQAGLLKMTPGRFDTVGYYLDNRQVGSAYSEFSDTLSGSFLLQPGTYTFFAYSDARAMRLGSSQIGSMEDFASTRAILSTQPVPEPATMAVLGLGALGLLRRRRKG